MLLQGETVWHTGLERIAAIVADCAPLLAHYFLTTNAHTHSNTHTPSLLPSFLFTCLHLYVIFNIRYSGKIHHCSGVFFHPFATVPLNLDLLDFYSGLLTPLPLFQSEAVFLVQTESSKTSEKQVQYHFVVQ